MCVRVFGHLCMRVWPFVCVCVSICVCLKGFSSTEDRKKTIVRDLNLQACHLLYFFSASFLWAGLICIVTI